MIQFWEVCRSDHSETTGINEKVRRSLKINLGKRLVCSISRNHHRDSVAFCSGMDPYLHEAHSVQERLLEVAEGPGCSSDKRLRRDQQSLKKVGLPFATLDWEGRKLLRVHSHSVQKVDCYDQLGASGYATIIGEPP